MLKKIFILCTLFYSVTPSLNAMLLRRLHRPLVQPQSNKIKKTRLLFDKDNLEIPKKWIIGKITEYDNRFYTCFHHAITRTTGFKKGKKTFKEYLILAYGNNAETSICIENYFYQVK